MKPFFSSSNPFYKLVTLIFPERCPYCGALIESGRIACDKCYENLRKKHIPITGGVSGFRCVSSFTYAGKIRKTILNIKYRERTQYIPQIAAILADDIRSVFKGTEFDFITAVPMHKADIKERGFNQSELLAEALGKELSLPFCDTLVKIKRTKKQHTLTYAQRKKNLNGAFIVADKEAIKGKKILLIDDIITSRETLSVCCRTLCKAKPLSIHCAAIAHAGNDYPEQTEI